MKAKTRSRFRIARSSLRTKVALGVALPLLIMLTALVMAIHLREHQLFEDQIRLTATQLSESLKGSLRHAMLVDNRKMVASMLIDVGNMDNIEAVEIINLDGQVRITSAEGILEQPRPVDESVCQGCHLIQPESRPSSINLSTEGGILRIATWIANEDDCRSCHDESAPHLGVLFAEVSLVHIQDHLLVDLEYDLVFSIAITLLVTFVAYMLIDWMVVRRVEAFRAPLLEYANGDFSSRLPVDSGQRDALGELAAAFNHMADELDRHSREQEEQSETRHRAIVEERERIARELHDGMAQLLGYVNTKAMAVRFMIKNQQVDQADRNLLQLEEAARALFVDVRESILNLKMAGREGASLVETLEELTDQFGHLSNLPVELSYQPSLQNLNLSADTELQILRIVQEALTNTRKYALASQAWVSLQKKDGVLEVTVKDDGRGFDPDQAKAGQRPHFGLSTMRERAAAIGADFGLVSSPGAGVVIHLLMPLEEE